MHLYLFCLKIQILTIFKWLHKFQSMHFAIIAPETPTKNWKENFQKIAPYINLEIGLEPNHPEKVVCAMVWNQPKGALKPFKNLKLIFDITPRCIHISKLSWLKWLVIVSNSYTPRLKSCR